MWLLAKDGFYSIVQKPEDKAGDMLSVRARRREDLEKLIEFTGGEIIVTPHADYPYRIVIEREVMAQAAWEMVMQLDYGNFKGSIKEDQRHDIYMAVWGCLRRLEDRLKPKAKPVYTNPYPWHGEGYYEGFARPLNAATTPRKKWGKKKKGQGQQSLDLDKPNNLRA